MNIYGLNVILAEPSRARSGAPWVRKSGNLSIQEITFLVKVKKNLVNSENDENLSNYQLLNKIFSLKYFASL